MPPLGFRRTNKRRNATKHEFSHQQRQNLDISVRNQVLGLDTPGANGVKIEKTIIDTHGGLKGGLSKGRPHASHRKRTTRQLHYATDDSCYI